MGTDRYFHSGGIAFTWIQVVQAKKSNRAVFLLRLSEIWSNHEMYEAVSFINSLRVEWKNIDKNPKNWDDLAKKWIEDSLKKRAITVTKLQPDYWMYRRDVAQLLSQMYQLLNSKYILEDDLFGLIPEAKRLLIVLIPIEKAIVKEFSSKEVSINKKWDVPSAKKLIELEKRYDRWLKNKTTI